MMMSIVQTHIKTNITVFLNHKLWFELYFMSCYWFAVTKIGFWRQCTVRPPGSA